MQFTQCALLAAGIQFGVFLHPLMPILIRPPASSPKKIGGRPSLALPICSADLLGFWILPTCFADLFGFLVENGREMGQLKGERERVKCAPSIFVDRNAPNQHYT